MTFLFTYVITKFTRNRHNEQGAPSVAAFYLGFPVQKQELPYATYSVPFLA